MEDFERQWLLAIANYNLQANKYMIGLYQINHFWYPLTFVITFLWHDNYWTFQEYKCIIKHFFPSLYKSNSICGLAIEDVAEN